MHLDVQHDIHVARVPDPPEMSTAYSGSPRPREQQALERAGSCYILSPRLLTTASAGAGEDLPSLASCFFERCQGLYLPFEVLAEFF